MSSGSFNLKIFRTEKLKVTQTQMAETLGIRQDMLSRYEDDPENIPIRVFKAISEKYGIEFNQLLDYHKNSPDPLLVKNSWTKIKHLKQQLLDCINTHYSPDNPEQADVLNILSDNIHSLTTKPKVVFLGRSDSGKSTMINALLGSNDMPTNWTPVTSIIVYIKHIEDRPSYINEDLWVFKNDDKGMPWNDSRLSDQKYTTSLKIASGSAEMLSSYGTGTGKKYIESKETISSAVLFLDSPILKNCDILDVPGFTGGKPSDVKAAEFASTKANILIYLSQANSFMGIDDVIYLKGGIENLSVLESNSTPTIPVLSNLFVVATQAHIINNGNEEEINKILDSGSNRFCNTLTDSFWKDREKISGGCIYTKEVIRKRFFAYTTDIKSVRAPFETQLKETIEQLPHLLFEGIGKSLLKCKSDLLNRLDSKLKHKKTVLTEYEALKKELANRELNRSRIMFEFREHRNDIIREIEKCRLRTWDMFNRDYANLLNESSLIELLKSRNTQNRKNSKEEFLAFLSSRLDEIYKQSAAIEAKKLSERIDYYSDSCQELFDYSNVLSNSEYKHACIDLYNTKRIFYSGLLGGATFGALAFWASTFGNLGGYIIVTKAVSLLAALGIHVGGTAAAVSTVAALGGPVAWGIGLAAIIGIGVYATMGGGWKKQFANTICSEMNKRNVLLDFQIINNNYWNETLIAFEAGADKVEQSWLNQTQELKENVENYDVEKINKHISQIIEAKKAIEDIL